MADDIFIIQNDGELVEMSEHAYDSEALLQELLAKYPKLLAGGQMDTSSPRRWLLVRREMGIPSKDEGGGRFSVDHLFLDQDAIPTLVEVKRSTDTRLRREVVGQMLDYAANAVMYWPVEQIQAEFEAGSDDAEDELAQLLGEDPNQGEFWEKVKTNLQAGKIRMVFVADVIPSELRRIVEFLNEQMDPAEVLAVEIKQFVGEGMKTLVPRVMGQTAEAEKKKRPRGGTRVNTEARLAFWTAFTEMVRTEAPDIGPGPPTDGARMDFAVENPDLEIRSRADCHTRTLSVTLSIQGEDAQERLTRLLHHVDTIRDSLKMPWDVGRGKKGKGSFLNVVHSFDVEAEDAWPELHQWIVDAVREARNVLVPVVK